MEQVAFQNNSKLEEYATSLQDLATEIEALEKQYSGVSTEIDKERDEFIAAEKLVAELTEKEAALKVELEETQRNDKELSAKYREMSKEQITVESRLNSLKEVAASLEGAKEGISEFLSNNPTEDYNVLGSSVRRVL
jgi:chromosome segregation protein